MRYAKYPFVVIPYLPALLHNGDTESKIFYLSGFPFTPVCPSWLGKSSHLSGNLNVPSRDRGAETDGNDK